MGHKWVHITHICVLYKPNDGIYFQGLVERDEEIKKAREEALKTQRSLEEQLNEERAASQDIQVCVITFVIFIAYQFSNWL